jgi:hypothetical protein
MPVSPIKKCLQVRLSRNSFLRWVLPSGWFMTMTVSSGFGGGRCCRTSSCDRDQELLLSPSLRDWLGEDHLAWCVFDAVEQIGLGGILWRVSR